MLATRKFSGTVTALLLVGITAAAAWLRFFQIGHKSYWWDEIATVEICRSPLSQFWPWLWRSEANMSFYYLLVRFWIRHGDSEAWMRGFSAILAVLSIPVIYIVGTRLAGRRTGLLAALLLAINATHIAYAQEARSYALLMLLCLLSMLFFLCIRNSGPLVAIAYVAVSTLAVYVHFFAVFFLVAQWVSILWLHKDDKRWKKFLLPTLVTGVLVAPALFYMLFRRSGQLALLPPTEFKDLIRMIYFLVADSGRFHKALALLYLLCFGIAVRWLFYAWRLDPRSDRNWEITVVLSCAVMPVLIVFPLSFWVTMFYPRYMLICLMWLILLAALGLAELRPTWVQFGITFFIVVLSAGSLRWYYENPKDDWRSLTAYLLQNAESGDVIVGPVGAEWPMQYYGRRNASLLKPGVSYITPQMLKTALEDHRSTGKALPGPRVWMVDWSTSREAQDFPQKVSPEYRRIQARRFPRSLLLDLYTNSVTGPAQTR
jgi:uncharacterized membrane protein